MSSKEIIQTDKAPKAIGPYSQAVKVGTTVYISGQIPLDPESMELVSEDVSVQAEQVFNNIHAVAVAAGGKLEDAVKINISLTDLNDFDAVNQVMMRHLAQPYPARACVGVAALPRNSKVEIETILAL